MKKRSSKTNKQWFKATADTLGRALHNDIAKDLEAIAASMTEQEKLDYEQYERGLAFDKKYVLRKDYERDLELEKSRGRMEAAIFCLLILPPILVSLFLLLRAIGWIEPGDFGIN